MNGEDCCVVCGDVSAALICRECQALIGARPLEPEATAPAPIWPASPPKRSDGGEHGLVERAR